MTAVPSWAADLQAGYERYVAAETAFRAELAAAANLVQGGLADKVLKGCARSPGAVLADALLDVMFARARADFRPKGGDLTLSFDAVCAALGLEEPKQPECPVDLIVAALSARQVDLPGVWAAITALCTSDECRDAALVQTARALTGAFYLSFQQAEIRRVAGRPVLLMRVSTERPSRGLGRRLGWQFQADFESALSSLNRVAEWAGVANPVPDRALFPARDAAFQSRARFVMSPALTIVAFYERLEFHLSEAFAGELSRFVGQYAADQLARQRAAG